MTDSSASGYRTGDLWNASGLIYQSLQDIPGKAVWSPLPAATALPCDAVPGAVAAYGMQRLTSSYAKDACIDVMRASDKTTLTIGFLNSGLLDTPRLDAFLAGTSGQITRWYDQSGNGNDAIQPAFQEAPSVTPLGTIGNSRSVVFDNVGQGFVPKRGMVIPDNVAIDYRNHSVICLSRFRNTASSGSPLEFTDGQGLTKLYYGWHAVGCSTYVGRTGTHLGNSRGAAMSSTAFVSGYTSGAPASSCFVEEFSFPIATPHHNISKGGFLGRKTDKPSGFFDIGALIIYGSALNASECHLSRAALHRAFATYPQIRDVWMATGDSQTDGLGSTLMQNYVRQAIPILDKPMNVYTVGLIGQTVAQVASNFRHNALHRYNPHAKNNILTILAGTNNSANSVPAEVYAELSDYVRAAQQVGFKVGIATMLPMSKDGVWKEFQPAYNALIRNNAAGAEAIIDIASDPIMGDAKNTSDKTLFTDGLHLTNLGNSYLASYFAEAINSMLI